MSLAEILTLMTAATSAAVTIINALKHRSTSRKVDSTLAATSQIKVLVNGQSEALRRALDAAQERCQVLEAELARLQGESSHGPLPPSDFVTL